MLGVLRRAAVALQQAYEAGAKIVADGSNPFTVQDKTGSGYFFELLSNTGSLILRIGQARIDWYRGFYMNSKPYVYGALWTGGSRMTGDDDGVDWHIAGTDLASMRQPAAPAAGDTVLQLGYHDGTAWQPLGRVAWKDGASIGAGDKVLVLK